MTHSPNNTLSTTSVRPVSCGDAVTERPTATGTVPTPLDDANDQCNGLKMKSGRRKTNELRPVKTADAESIPSPPHPQECDLLHPVTQISPHATQTSRLVASLSILVSDDRSEYYVLIIRRSAGEFRASLPNGALVAPKCTACHRGALLHIA
ncbi:hypothetical protein DPEC_G00291530 [Dallia pectoralis]|uniref:Uncharacterized protein n=1 Tax=Dallia pectoralis TaxID=75939 RepID=A0ACC2FHN6_DALPE|nr:hypothetical protein DPEC_G00291530 [Dallia pectoralis]